MNRHEGARTVKQTEFSLSQGSVTVLTVGLGLAGLILAHPGELRADRAGIESAMNLMRAKGRRGNYLTRHTGAR